MALVDCWAEVGINAKDLIWYITPPLSIETVWLEATTDLPLPSRWAWEVDYDFDGKVLLSHVERISVIEPDEKILQEVFAGVGAALPHLQDRNCVRIWRDGKDVSESTVLSFPGLIAGRNSEGVYLISQTRERRTYSFQKWEEFLLHCGAEGNGGYVAKLAKKGNRWIEKEVINIPQPVIICCAKKNGEILALSHTGIWAVPTGGFPFLLYGSAGLAPKWGDRNTGYATWRWGSPTSMVVVEQHKGEENYRGNPPVNIMVGTEYGFILIKEELNYAWEYDAAFLYDRVFWEFWCLPEGSLSEKLQKQGITLSRLEAEDRKLLGFSESFGVIEIRREDEHEDKVGEE